jgi:hypothetical protein
LVLYHLNAEALRTQSSKIELEDSLTASVKRTLGLDPKGRNIRTVKNQLSRLSASDFRIGTSHEDRSLTLKGTIVEGFEIWTSRDSKQRVLWPSTVHFSERYFESLMKHAVPLNEIAIRHAGAQRDGAGSVHLAGAASAPYRLREVPGTRPVEGAQGSLRAWVWPDG